MNQHINQEDDRLKSLEAFANASAAPSNMMVASAQAAALSSPDRVFGAQNVAVHRDESKVLQKLAALGAAAGDDWGYRFPVRNKRKGTTEYVEGPSIKLANDLARIYGNCEIDTRVIDLGSSWLIYARFTDYETGYALTRPFQQQKGGSKMGGDDDARRLDIAFQIGVSKAIRNVTVNALQTYADFAHNAARNSLVEKIGKNLQGYRERTVQGIENLGVELHRVELVIGKASKDWTAPDVSRVIAMMKGIADGMATVDETFPPKDDVKTDAETGEKLREFANAGHDPETGEIKEPGPAAARAGTEPSAKDPDNQAVDGSGTNQGSQSDTAPPQQASGAKEGAGTEDGRSAASASPNTPAPSPTNSNDPANDAAYKAYALAWIAETPDRENRMARWGREKTLRNKANVTPETRDELEKLVKAKS